MVDSTIKACKGMLKKVSRSFALSIPMLDEDLYRPVMITYLQDRLLDNFEDEIKGVSVAERKYLMDRVVDIFNPGNQKPEEAIDIIEENASRLKDKSLQELTENAHILYNAFSGLDQNIQEISHKWFVEMNQGMKKYLTRQVETFSDLDEYCYYVAGTVGGFLTDVLIYKGFLDDRNIEILLNNYKDAGLFLQKVNIIRDIKKDIRKREKYFWPLKSLELTKVMISDSRYKEEALSGLNKMIDDVKGHVDGLVKYMNALPDNFPGYRKFFALNNALGLATLKKLRNNPDVFYGQKKVKVKKIRFLQILKSPEKSFYQLSKDV